MQTDLGEALLRVLAKPVMFSVSSKKGGLHIQKVYCWSGPAEPGCKYTWSDCWEYCDYCDCCDYWDYCDYCDYWDYCDKLNVLFQFITKDQNLEL